MKTPLEYRNELLKAKDELITIMREIINPINIVACRLDAEATKLIPSSLDESISTNKRRKSAREAAPQPSISLPIAPSKVAKRACSICRKSGHRATTCPSRSKT